MVETQKITICRQDISAYRGIKTFITFLSSRVAKKNFFKRPRIKFCLMRTMIINKIERPKNLWRQREQIHIEVEDGI